MLGRPDWRLVRLQRQPAAPPRQIGGLPLTSQEELQSSRAGVNEAASFKIVSFMKLFASIFVQDVNER